ncbi:MFS transporter [uncultured Jannaschia sp.]|uniref:MFS transporter n=1 Tax=uncultured Jannaschia sp. TaxID=293347 RepID=UPI00260BDC0A|nr:MFS transporter [uncultured Jannaschia sp.]
MTHAPRTGFGAFIRDNAKFLAAGMLISFTSSYGQTFFIALFADDIMAEYGLSDGGWGLLYAAATIASAAAMVFAGVLTDRLRVRRLAVFVGLGLAAACLAMAGAQGLAALVAVVFALRFLGQGMMSHLSAVAMARWFVATRGKALAISATGFALGQAVLPVAFVGAEPWLGWRMLWVVAAGLTILAIPAILTLLRAERTPQAVAAETVATGIDARHWTRGEMLRSGTFWALVPLLLGPPAFGTALFFHQVHLAAVKGWPLIDYVALLPLLTVVSVAVMLASGAAIDRVGAARLMQVYLLPFALAFLLMGLAQTLWGAALALVVFGIGTGAQGTLPTAMWAELYGTRHLGAIKAMAAAVMVLGSALGPGLTGWIIDRGIDFPGQMTAIALYFLAAGALAAVALHRARARLAPEIDVIRA